MKRPLAVFDIDGTLVDSRASILQAATEAARDLGLPDPHYDRVRQIVGLSLPHALAVLEPDLGPAELERFTEAFRASFGRMFDAGHEEPLYPGALDTLRRLHRDGWRLSLATGQNRRGVARNLAREGWGELFVSSHCAEDGPGKPDPAMLHAAMTAAGAGAADTIMIGDTAHDISMALNAGVRPQGVAWGFHTPEEQIAAGAPHVATDFADLEVALDRFASRAFA
ncbi:Pyrophosphatase PpaX [Brevundimonas subvibrioides]|uniref:HAD-superfamily hydrolase, subfamily IA, variant 1 n=1 Tax=Brevundimonas subvibrioides (strain ATCC 15264 / DSM 4735 / LMG 14903 / NBRC 16000 / CB 81) TaxID=633149 RepID=D9QGQ0_BRESC|nr:HAD-IA family hydrolase [Brevundimonas subvibrioides]ADL00866.1 HAD-superfamily hydrolase, subfamily IA, variant 1 [Brevundimonas subvibrioides ATCC 15264]